MKVKTQPQDNEEELCYFIKNLPRCPRNHEHLQSIQLCLQLLSALNGYFLSKLNTAFVHQKFHQLQQKEGETILQFVTGLRN